MSNAVFPFVIYTNELAVKGWILMVSKFVRADDQTKNNASDNIKNPIIDCEKEINKHKHQIKKYNINELFEDYEGDYTPEEEEWGNPVGKEEW